jgi:hypothetical protein
MLPARIETQMAGAAAETGDHEPSILPIIDLWTIFWSDWKRWSGR